jgi:Fe-S cluster assembly ATP-binding protein
MMLEIKNLQVEVQGKAILKGLNLTVKPGEVHAIMGPNGSGKSTLASALAGKPGYDITAGEAIYCGQDLLAMEPEQRAVMGMFLGFQYPVEIPGVNNSYFLKTALNAKLKAQGQDEIDSFDFLALIKQHLATLDMDPAFLKRALNCGFSGGEKKRNEVLQMLLLQPNLAILDETDSGLDVDALQIVAKGVNSLRDPNRSFVLITHYQRLLDYIVPDMVHVLFDGQIVESGDKSLALKVEQSGYSYLRGESV